MLALLPRDPGFCQGTQLRVSIIMQLKLLLFGKLVSVDQRAQKDGMGREVGGGFRWGTHVNPWLIHVNVWQKPL